MLLLIISTYMYIYIYIHALFSVTRDGVLLISILADFLFYANIVSNIVNTIVSYIVNST